MTINEFGQPALLLTTSLLLCAPVFANNQINAGNNFSISAATTYSKVDHSINDSEGGGFEAHFGYSINSSWSIELGYLDALSENPSEPDYDSDSLYGHGYQLKGVMLAVLGKAAFSEGELYYRAGIMQAEIDSTTFYEADYDGFDCNNGLISGYKVNWDDVEYNFFKCEISSKKNAALIGLGYKYDINDSWFFRTEARRIFVRNDFYVDNVSLGIGYQF